MAEVTTPSKKEIIMQSWLLLIIAIILEVAGTTSMKFSAGFTRVLPSVLIFVFYFLSFTAFVFVLKEIPVSIAYAVWAGMGTALVAVIGILYFKETLNAAKLVSIALIITGVVGLHLSDFSK
jgi:small multidrug resistance pump